MKYLVFGDWGFISKIQTQVAKLIETLRIENVIALGDNFYSYGVQSKYDSLWRTAFEDVYPPGVKFHCILGNHDYCGDTQAQIEYTTLNPQRWYLPSRYYMMNRTVGNNSVDFFFIDTFELAVKHSQSLYLGSMGSNKNGDFFNIINRLNQDRQLEWLENELKNSTANFRVVYGHYPCFSPGSHGDTEELHKTLLPLLKKYDVCIYFSGHDHIAAIKEEENINYVISGCGYSVGKTYPDDSYTKLPTNLGISYLEILDSGLEFGFYNINGSKIYKKILNINKK